MSRKNGNKNRMGKIVRPNIQEMRRKEAPSNYPDWLQSVFNDFQIMINTARKDYDLTSDDIQKIIYLCENMCEYVNLASVHFSHISNVSIDKLGNLEVIKQIVDKYVELNEQIKQEKENEETSD